MNVRVVCIAALLAAVTPAAFAATPDAVVKAQLERKETPYEIDSDGDFAIIFGKDSAANKAIQGLAGAGHAAMEQK